MDTNTVISEIQSLHALVIDNYRWDQNNVLPAKGYDSVVYALNKHVLKDLGFFGSTKEERERKLLTIAAILPLKDWKHGQYLPIELDSTNRLWIGEMRALSTWIRDSEDIDTVRDVIRAISTDPQGWSIKLRKHLGWIERPRVEVPYGEKEPEDVGDEASPHVQQALPF